MDYKELREELAALAHQRWAHWMKYQFGLTALNEYGQAVVPTGLVERWKRQMDCPYDQLSEQEKDSDRKEADLVLALLAKSK